MFSYKYFTYQIFMDTCNEKFQNNISPCEETRNIIHDYSSRTIYLSIYIYIYIYILNVRIKEYEIIIYVTIHIPTRGEQHDFIQSLKSFWSCTHENSC